MEVGGIVGVRGPEDTWRTWPTESNKQTHRGAWRLNRQSWSLHDSVLSLLRFCYNCYLVALVGLLVVGMGAVADSVVCSWEAFSPTRLPQPNYQANISMRICA